jgi:hypothetical protein
LLRNLILLQETNNGIKLLNDEVAKISLENRSYNEQVAARREDLIRLESYLPGQGQRQGKQSLSELTQRIIENEMLEAKLAVIKQKLACDKRRLDSLTTKLKQMPPVEKERQAVQKAMVGREHAEELLERNHNVLGDLLAQKTFVENERTLFEQRLGEGRSELQNIEEETANLRAELERQQMMIKLSEQMDALRKLNLERVAGTVSDVLRVKSELGGFGS